MFILGIDKSIKPFLEEILNIRIRDKFVLTKCGNYFVLLEPNHINYEEIHERRISCKKYF